MVADYWDNIFTARERGQKVVWYNGSAVNPFFQAAGLAWCHGEAFSARLAAQHLEKPAQLAAEEAGYVGELCSYSRTHLGCAVLTRDSGHASGTGVVGLPQQQELASRLPAPDFFVNAYAGCSTGQQWDDISFRVFGKEVPIFNVSMPYLWGNKPDAGYLVGEEWDQASRYVADQLRELVTFIESMTGQPFDWDALRQNMAYIKRASELRREAMALCAQAPTPATFFDWIASIAHINFLPASQELVDYFAAVKAEIEQRIAEGVPAVRNERYRVYFDGFMNWNKLGFLARKFADHGVTVIAGRYTHQAFWQEPHLIDPENPLLGMAQHYLLCPTNHGTKTIKNLVLRDCEQYGVDGIVFHSTRTCRAFTNPQKLVAKAAQRELGIPSMFFEGDVADASFYKDEILESRLAAMLEGIDVRRSRAAATSD
ncbi:2-hydroxyacyl-CoA dehydratase family protein [Rhodococcus opacus]|uniref:2-hydroxyacyl-CoA dehydratase family protein n=1 Tax=Rhodococcus opacus TaxID=37919 RepID=A0ABT4NPA0_RHOOP|nr:2-hydroxyacyl-CoA dehydratase family protein [Rhodococcus opacus]MCZ4589206.1 2-hydroxyacyl-CoA dehydratase family protein [Rhodococcus opacus]MDV7089312.1 2-hydroxyacyl-CoA dehydratase family protein [Rhodococcus opacus]WKN61411.1 2-hydroxyacyl-CoA dehydratase family protein [Rhodococcus opacus]